MYKNINLLWEKEFMETKAKKKWKTPHTFVILVVIILIAAAATYIVPAGEFTRFKDAATGKTLVEAGSYHRIASSPLNPLKIPSAIYTGIVKSASTITFMLIIGGAFQVITSTGALTALCKKLSKTFSKHKYVVIPVFLTLFSIFGFTMGMSSEVMIFVPIGITLALFLGLDKVTGTAMIALGAAVGFTAGLLNPFNVGVAQDIAELQLFSGMAYRVFILVVLLAGDLDMFFGYNSVSNTRLSYETIYEDCLVAILPKSHPAVSFAESKESCIYPWLDLAHVRKERFILQHSNQSIRQLEEDALFYADVLPELTYKISSIDAGIRLAEQGYGIAFTLNSYLNSMMLSPNSVVLQVGDPDMRIPFSAAFRKEDENRKELKEWIRLTKELY